MNNKTLCILFILILSFLWACASKPAPVTTETKKAPEVIASPQVKAGWEAEWETVQKEAKKEGKVSLYSILGADMRLAFTTALQRFGITLESVSGRGTEIAERLLREKKAGISNADLMFSGLDTFIVLKHAGLLSPVEPLLILPEVKDPKMWYRGELPFADKERTIFVFIGYLDPGIHVNTDIVKPGDLTIMRDMLLPKWEGKIIMDDPLIAGRGQRWLTVVALKLGEDYLKQLANQKPFATRDRRQLIDWLAKGRYPIGIGVYPDEYQEYKRAGAPVNNLPLKEVSYLLGGAGHMGYIDRAPHPNATKVFLNWLWSKEGQIVWQNIRNDQSTRVDTPVDHLIQSGQPVRQSGEDYYETRTESWQLEVWPKGEKIVVDTFKTLLR